MRVNTPDTINIPMWLVAAWVIAGLILYVVDMIGYAKIIRVVPDTLFESVIKAIKRKKMRRMLYMIPTYGLLWPVGVYDHIQGYRRKSALKKRYSEEKPFHDSLDGP